ncbi:HD-GYP domain-containing protein, partial [Klebsiella quasipneumoniae]
SDAAPVARLIRAHHEAFDGSGYPDGLRGESIPLGARIVTIADAYDAMTSVRPYRDAMEHETALRIIDSQSG